MLPGDDPCAVEEASVAAKLLEQLKRLRALAVAARLPAAAYMVAREWDQLQLQLGREIDRQFAEERARVQATQEAALEVRHVSATGFLCLDRAASVCRRETSVFRRDGPEGRGM